LKPVPCTIKMLTSIVTRQVHKDNTIFYKGCRYTLPLGTFYNGPRKCDTILQGISDTNLEVN